MKIFQRYQNSLARTGWPRWDWPSEPRQPVRLAIGALATGRIAIRQGRIDKLTIGELTVDKPIVREQISAAHD